ncbi:hypothetical protein Cma02nite_28070 [Cellulomonas marina]|nr:hypothetical protein Cma02nite_28070 [Cellulomonas marina]
MDDRLDGQTLRRAGRQLVLQAVTVAEEWSVIYVLGPTPERPSRPGSFQCDEMPDPLRQAGRRLRSASRKASTRSGTSGSQSSGSSSTCCRPQSCR